MKLLLATIALSIAAGCGEGGLENGPLEIESLITSARERGLSIEVKPNGASFNGGEVEIVVPSETQATGPCPSSRVCIWKDSDFQGNRYQFSDRDICQNLNDYGASDVASSWNNGTSVTSCLYEHRDCGGKVLIMSSGAKGSGMGSFNDKASSIRVKC